MHSFPRQGKKLLVPKGFTWKSAVTWRGARSSLERRDTRIEQSKWHTIGLLLNHRWDLRHDSTTFSQWLPTFEWHNEPGDTHINRVHHKSMPCRPETCIVTPSHVIDVFAREIRMQASWSFNNCPIKPGQSSQLTNCCEKCNVVCHVPNTFHYSIFTFRNMWIYYFSKLA